jgi:hypothetical protein
MREQDGIVRLPFNSEFSVLLKNLNTTRAAVRVFIDDTDVLNSSRLIIDPNEDCELEGFLNGNDVTHRFKFIEKTEQISDYRGDRAGDGIVRVEFEFEQKPAIIHHTITYDHHHNGWPRWPWTYGAGTWTYQSGGDVRVRSLNANLPDAGGTQYSCNVGPQTPTAKGTEAMGMSSSPSPSRALRSCQPTAAAAAADAPTVGEGITVKGSASDQTFKTGYLGLMEGVKHVINLKLMGFTESKEKVERPVAVKTKLVCETCGRHCKSSAKFCPNCGTALW